MADMLESIDNLPDISFIDNLTLGEVQALLLNAFYENYKAITGKKITLARADPYRVMMLSTAQVIYQGLQQVDRAGKMNFLKYAYGDYLKNLAALKRVTAKEPEKAQVQVRWKLEEPREAATPIPAGSRITADYAVYFETADYAEIPAGEKEIVLMMYCTEAGEQGNGYMAGELSVLVDPVAFIASVANIETTAKGTGEESDQSIAERTYLAPSSFSTAGPDDAYVYHAKSYSQEVGDVLPTSPTPGVVDIRFILKDGGIPNETMIAGMAKHLQQRSKRPLTDKVEVAAPDVVTYSVDITYYINASDMSSATQIQTQAQQAVQEYELWQCTGIGRDINPDELMAYLKKAGIKRAVIRQPVFKVLADTEVAKVTSTNIVYGGIEND